MTGSADHKQVEQVPENEQQEASYRNPEDRAEEISAALSALATKLAPATGRPGEERGAPAGRTGPSPLVAESAEPPDAAAKEDGAPTRKAAGLTGEAPASLVEAIEAELVERGVALPPLPPRRRRVEIDEHRHLLKYIARKHEHHNYVVYTPHLLGYPEAPAGWSGVVPDLVAEKYTKQYAFFVEDETTLRDARTAGDWAGCLTNPHTRVHIIVRSKHDLEKARKLVDRMPVRLLLIAHHQGARAGLPGRRRKQPLGDMKITVSMRSLLYPVVTVLVLALVAGVLWLVRPDSLNMFGGGWWQPKVIESLMKETTYRLLSTGDQAAKPGEPTGGEAGERSGPASP